MVRKIALSAVVVLCAAGIVLAAQQKKYEGLVISFDSKSVEVKKGKAEKTFLLGEDTVIVEAPKSGAGKTLSICQKVRVYYTVRKEGAVAEKIIILKKGYCDN